jgi:tRNA pseudouridine13 synthase
VSVPEIDRQMGIEVYLTKTQGVGGAIRRSIDDFVVEEVLVDGSKATALKTDTKPALGASLDRQPFLLCVLVKRNWDTFIAVKNVAKELGINQERIQIAGIKDAKAVTAQYVTIEGVSAEEAAEVKYNDVELRPIGYFREPLCSFYLLGNNFKIITKEIELPKTTVEERATNTWGEVESAGGIPNFYGHQRFGTIRAITHLVGKAMVKGDMEEAAMIFLAKPSLHEHPESMRVRAELQTTKDFEQAHKDFPRQLRFERTMLAYLAEKPTDFSGAFRCLPAKLQLLFVQAWQSYLFNRFLSARIKAGFSLTCVEVGDYVVNVERNGVPMVKTSKIVEVSNVEDTNLLVKAGKLRVALPLFGIRQKLSKGVMGDLERHVLEEEKVEPEGFRVPALPEVGARGELRAAVCPVKTYSMGAVSDDSDRASKLSLEFLLLRGAYATVLLREIMKPIDMVAAGF